MAKKSTKKDAGADKKTATKKTAAPASPSSDDARFHALVEFLLPAVNNLRLRMREEPLSVKDAMREIDKLAKKL
jgi:hypothetical protein